MRAQKRKGALVRKESGHIENLFLEKKMEIDIDPFAARVWEDIRNQHLPCDAGRFGIIEVRAR